MVPGPGAGGEGKGDARKGGRSALGRSPSSNNIMNRKRDQ